MVPTIVRWSSPYRTEITGSYDKSERDIGRTDVPF